MVWAKNARPGQENARPVRFVLPKLQLSYLASLSSELGLGVFMKVVNMGVNFH